MLTDAGFECTRSGLAHRRAPNGRQYRWYLRLEGDITKEGIDEFFLGAPGEWTGTLEDWMAQFDLETDGLIAEKEHLAEQVGVLGTDLRKARRRLEDLARSSEALESQLMDVVEVLLPEVEFLRDSRKVILRELSSFRPVIAELHQIEAVLLRRVEHLPTQETVCTREVPYPRVAPSAATGTTAALGSNVSLCGR